MRKWNGKAEYVTIKEWVTGECTAVEDSDIMTELHDLARDHMVLVRLADTITLSYGALFRMGVRGQIHMTEHSLIYRRLLLS